MSTIISFEGAFVAGNAGQVKYDTLIKGGEVLDPGSGVNGQFDVAIKDGKIAAVEADIDRSQAREVIHANGQIVTPGLIDLHTHIYWGVTYWGIEADPVAARSGVTTWLDVGSAGAYSFPGFREYIARPSRSRVFALLNLSSIGLIAPTWEFNNPDYCDVDLAEKIIEGNRDIILGVKARIDRNTTRGVGIYPLERARELADRVGLPLMTHIGYGPPTLDEVIPHLRPGDILTHCFTGGDHRILGKDKVVNADIKKLHDAGLILDIGHGTGSFNYDVAEGLMEQGIMPDVISTDIHQMAIQGPMFDMPTTLSKFLNLGMSLPDVIERATVRAAKAIKLDHLGTLGIGKPADIALFKLEEGDYTYYDSQMNARNGEKRLISTKTLIDGQLLPNLPERELHVWAGLPDHQASVFGSPETWRPRRP
jgi:dihydroorotase